ncbi:MAG: hypothetical protein IH969_07800 [Candidatus Krumholzibacteriota bacterium]|nr:hypothetical protein [Candidatus Krumholzibacteriota bacterium]
MKHTPTLKGYLSSRITRDMVTAELGTPDFVDPDGYKITMEWIVDLGEDMTMTVYDYKEDNQLHIGGNHPNVLLIAADFFGVENIIALNR